MPWWAWVLATLTVVGLVGVAIYFAILIWFADDWKGT